MTEYEKLTKSIAFVKERNDKIKELIIRMRMCEEKYLPAELQLRKLMDEKANEKKELKELLYKLDLENQRHLEPLNVICDVCRDHKIFWRRDYTTDGKFGCNL